MGRDGEANHVESQLSIPIEKRGQCSLVLRNGAMGARVLVVEILNEPNDLIMDIRQQFSLSALHIQGSLGQRSATQNVVILITVHRRRKKKKMANIKPS